MSTRRKSGRSRETGRARPGNAPTVLGDLAAEVAEHLIGLPLDYGTTVEQIAALLAAEPRNRPSVCGDGRDRGRRAARPLP
ncbi:hypothetical protein [Lentzea albidocapillata]|uniref:hypothetical protein n=1 Tax=Lentzea albidocapillata TaxID=40571 RepID=UPI00115F7C88|nr:hypothetical protein [Lentzea albidocapillata]